jgi:hypothetical protein
MQKNEVQHQKIVKHGRFQYKPLNLVGFNTPEFQKMKGLTQFKP